MKRAIRVSLALCAFFVPAGLVVGCGGVPDNAVATVDGTSIEKTSFDHWLNVAAKSGGQQGAAVPDPPDYTKCVAAKRKLQPAKPPKGQPKVTESQLEDQCKQEYKALRDQVMQLLVSFKWIEGEAKAMGVKLSDAEVRKNFEKQRKQQFPKDADYKKFLKDSGQSEQDIIQRVRLELLSNKIRDKIVKGKNKVTPAQIEAYYEKNQARFSQPETRDLRVVLTKDKAKADEAKQALDSGDSWKTVAQEFSIDQASKTKGGKLDGVAKGTQEKGLDKAVFGAQEGKLVGPLKTQFGYYVFEVDKVTKADKQSLKEATPTIKQMLIAQRQQKALNTFVTDFRKRWKEKTECQDAYKTADCKNGPKSTPTPQPDAAPVQPPQGQGGAQQPGQGGAQQPGQGGSQQQAP
jgi:foldase protein PrsA